MVALHEVCGLAVCDRKPLVSKESDGPKITSVIVVVDSEGNERPFVPGALDDLPRATSATRKLAATQAEPFKWPASRSADRYREP